VESDVGVTDLGGGGEGAGAGVGSGIDVRDDGVSGAPNVAPSALEISSGAEGVPEDIVDRFSSGACCSR
jgi:hypothetical protein